jgi:nucleotide-binding universal stress UspA family protein
VSCSWSRADLSTSFREPHAKRARIWSRSPCHATTNLAILLGSRGRCSTAGIAVLTVPTLADRRPHVRRLGIGHDGSRPAAAALAVARRIAEAGRGQMTRLDIAYVDDSASSAGEDDSDVVASRRQAAIEWWLADLVVQVPAPVRPLRRVGDPACELAELSHDLDLLVIGTRGRAPLRRALTGSVSRELIAITRCPLLIVPPRTAAAMAAM